MRRCLLWLALYCCTCGILSADVTYTDGLHIRLVGWPDALSAWWRRRR